MPKEIRLTVSDDFDADEFVQALIAGSDRVVWQRYDSREDDTAKRYQHYDWIGDSVISGEIRESRRVYGKGS